MYSKNKNNYIFHWFFFPFSLSKIEKKKIVEFDIKNGFHDWFSFQKRFLLININTVIKELLLTKAWQFQTYDGEPVIKFLYVVMNSSRKSFFQNGLLIAFYKWLITGKCKWNWGGGTSSTELCVKGVVFHREEMYCLHRYRVSKLQIPDARIARCCKRQISCHIKQTLHTIATPYRRSSNTSRILTLVRYYAVIIARCGKLCM